MCNPLGDMRTQTQSAWHDGYATAKVEREWQGLTAGETKILRRAATNDREFADLISAKLKEKNNG